MDRRALAAVALSGRSFRFRGAYFSQNKKRRPSGEDRRSICSSCSRLPSGHPSCGTPVPEGPLLVSERLYHNPPASATNSARFALAQPARIRVRPALRSRGVRTPLPLSAARTRPGGSREAARRPDGTTTMGRERVPRRGLGDRRQRARLRWGQPAASPGGSGRRLSGI